MTCWECKITHDDPSHVCSSCRVRAQAEGSSKDQAPSLTMAQRLMMQCLRAQGLGYHHIARVTGRSVDQVVQQLEDLP